MSHTVKEYTMDQNLINAAFTMITSLGAWQLMNMINNLLGVGTLLLGTSSEIMLKPEIDQLKK